MGENSSRLLTYFCRRSIARHKRNQFVSEEEEVKVQAVDHAENVTLGVHLSQRLIRSKTWIMAQTITTFATSPAESLIAKYPCERRSIIGNV